MKAEPDEVVARVVGDDPDQAVAADDVGQEGVADEERKGEEEQCLPSFLQQLAGGPGRRGQGALRGGVAFDPVFEAAEDQFHEHGLRTGPAAPETSEGGGEDGDARQEEQEAQGEDGAVLGPEHLAEHGELALDDVDEEERVAVDADERPDEHDGQEQVADPDAGGVVAAAGLPGVNPHAGAPPGRPSPGDRGNPASPRVGRRFPDRDRRVSPGCGSREHGGNGDVEGAGGSSHEPERGLQSAGRRSESMVERSEVRAPVHGRCACLRGHGGFPRTSGGRARLRSRPGWFWTGGWLARSLAAPTRGS